MSRVQPVPVADEAVAESGVFKTFSSLRIRAFRYLWFGQLGSAMAMHSDIVARSWLAWELSHSTTAVALVNLARAIPMLTLGLFGGVVADRFDKRRVLMLIQAWTLAIYIVMTVVVLFDLVQLWHVYAYSLLIGVGFAMNQPVRMSFVPQLVDKAHLLNALSLSSIAINATRLAGPAAIALIISMAGGVGPAYAVSAGFYAIVLWTTMMIPRQPPVEQRNRGSMVGQLIEGFRFIGQNRMVLALVVLGLGPLAFGHSYITMLPAYVTQVLGHDDAGPLGLILSVGAVGGLSGGLLVASRGDIRSKGRLMIITGVIYGVALMVFGFLEWLLAVLPLVIVIGASQTIFRASNNSTLLELAPERLRGRIVSVTLLDTALGSVAAIIGGLIADSAGVSTGLFVMGVICFGIVALVAVLSPGVRRA
ncbi:MAG: MFS transporter [Dehalococcoidia bacterium]